MLRWLIVFTLSATPASAETSAADLQAWLCRIAPKAQRCRVPVPLPSVKSPLPPQRQPPVASQPSPTLAPPPQQAAPRATQGRQKGKPKAPGRLKTETQPTDGAQSAPPPSGGITCAQARQGVGMPCFLIRANSHHYDRLTPAQKRQADGCLTAAERAAIKACFK